MKKRIVNLKLTMMIGTAYLFIIQSNLQAVDYPIVDTGQSSCYDNDSVINAPEPGEDFYGQDAQYNDMQISPSYRDNEDGTITDLNTGLMWVKERGDKVSWQDAIDGADDCRVGEYDDWRMPTIKEIYSLIDFTGDTKQTIEASTPFIDTDYFDFEYGDEDAGERIIDCQDWSATEYVDYVFNGDEAVFGVNFADGRIKGYPKIRRSPNGNSPNELYARYVRGNSSYGNNDFVDNGDSTVTDLATGLTWSKHDSREGLNWEEALDWVAERNEVMYLGHDDWRLPNAKELQSIVDYSRSPSTTSSAAIDTVFVCSSIENEGGDDDYPFYWTNTTHIDGPEDVETTKAVYVCFGRASGWMQPPQGGDYDFLDVHGAGAQRSDPKEGDPDDYPYGFGPQGDVIRIYNYVRLVRGESEPLSVNPEQGLAPNEIRLYQNYPNPFNGSTSITFDLNRETFVALAVYNLKGERIWRNGSNQMNAGKHSITVDLTQMPSGVYLYELNTGDFSAVRRMTLTK